MPEGAAATGGMAPATGVAPADVAGVTAGGVAGLDGVPASRFTESRCIPLDCPPPKRLFASASSENPSEAKLITTIKTLAITVFNQTSGSISNDIFHIMLRNIIFNNNF
jgi:hypothetical protein